MKKLQLIYLLIFFISINANAVIRYVTPSGAGLMNGTSWLNAFPGTSLQAAINSSSTGDEVWVSTGTYLTTTGTNRNIYFSMLNGVAIYGSFNGTETNLSQRVFTCGYSSVLSAEINLPGNADNSYHVISNSSLNTTAILDGFTIRDANANFDLLGNDNRSLGGGIFNNAANGGVCSPTIRNCLFTNNTALFGGGIFDHGQNGGNANPVITNCIFASNIATNGGAAIDNFGYNGNASPVVTNTIFYNNNAANRAGAIYCWGGGGGNASPSFLNCSFVNNAAIDGGGIVSDRSNFTSGNSGTANPTMRNCIFWGNTASGIGPQFFIIGGAGFEATYSDIDISNQAPPHAVTGPGTGNINIAPTFVNSANGIGADNCWLTNDDGLQLVSNSAGVNVGNNTGVPSLDIRNTNRIFNGVVDMGPYEYSSVILPVNLVSFSGQAGSNSNTLSWSTVFENDNLVFEVERSIDAVQFEKIGAVNSAGNSNSIKHYRFTDVQLSYPQYYYRLKQIDKNGDFRYSNTITLLTRKDKNSILVFPNPVIAKTAVWIKDESLLNEEFSIINSAGSVLKKIVLNKRYMEIDLTGQASGLYFLVNKQKGIAIKIYKQ